ncbi:hypothetical protein GEMRC1_007473 [Eukaryota sp. GEM-RC1]
MNSLLLSLFSMYFHDLFSGGYQDSNDKKFLFQDQFRGVVDACFSNLFCFFRGIPIQFSTSNVLDYFQLGTYFRVDSVLKDCQSFVKDVQWTEKQLLELLQKVCIREHYPFLSTFQELFSVLCTNITFSPFAIPFQFFEILIPIVDNIFLLDCLVQTCLTDLSVSNEIPSVLNMFRFSSSQFDLLNLSVYPLLKKPMHAKIILNWIIQAVFDDFDILKSANFSIYPSDLFWNCFLLVAGYPEFERYVAPCISVFPRIITPDYLSSRKCSSLSPSILYQLCIGLPKEYHLCLLTILVSSWNSFSHGSSWNVELFNNCLSVITLPPTDPLEVFGILQSIKGSQELTNCINSFLVKNLSSFVYSKISSFLSSSQPAEVRTPGRVRVVPQPRTSSSGNSDSFRLLSEKYHRLCKFQDIPGLPKSVQTDDCLDTSRFVHSSYGSALALSMANTVVFKTGKIGHHDSFVEIPIVKQFCFKLTKLSITSKENNHDLIGFKPFDSLQSDSPPFPCFSSNGDRSSGSFVPTNPRFQHIRAKQSIIVLFENGKVYFKRSQESYFETDIPSNCAFGVQLYAHKSSWRIDVVDHSSG